MDSKIKLLAAVSVIAVMTSGCSRYGTGQGMGSSSSASSSSASVGSGQVAGTGQVSRGGLFGQRRADTCAPCATTTPAKNTYTYKPAPKPVYKAAPKPAVTTSKHNQQYYIDKWNREQAQKKNTNNNQQAYTGYGNNTASNTTYYDYSSAAKTTTTAPAPVANVSTSNKSIYTGSYQQPTYKPYQPTTYAGGSAATTNTTTTAVSSGGGSSYVVKKGDTVFEVMRQTGVYWKDIISMNNLVAPAYTINPGQTLRLK